MVKCVLGRERERTLEDGVAGSRDGSSGDLMQRVSFGGGALLAADNLVCICRRARGDGVEKICNSRNIELWTEKSTLEAVF